MTPAAIEERVELPRLQLAARVWRSVSRSSRPVARDRVVALHGWLDNAATFDGIAPLLCASASLPGLELVALDLPGHGRSDHRASGTYYFLDYVADVLAACDALGWEQFSIIGHSLGAGVGALVAGTAPERVARLVLLEGLGPLTNVEEDAPALLRRALEQERARARRVRASAARAKPPRAFRSPEEAATARLMAGSMGDRSALTLVKRALVEGEGGLRWRSDPQLRLPSRARLTEGQALAFLRAIQCPTLLVRALEGPQFSPEVMRARRHAIAALELVTLPGGHHVHLDDPGPVAAAVGEFLARTRGE